MTRKTKPCKVKVTCQFVSDPEAVERGRELWASYLAQHLAKRSAAVTPAKRQDPA